MHRVCLMLALGVPESLGQGCLQVCGDCRTSRSQQRGQWVSLSLRGPQARGNLTPPKHLNCVSYMRCPCIRLDPLCGCPEGRLVPIPPISSRVLDKVGRSGLLRMTPCETVCQARARTHERGGKQRNSCFPLFGGENLAKGLPRRQRESTKN